MFYEIRFHSLSFFRQRCDLAAWTRAQPQPQEWDELSGFIREWRWNESRGGRGARGRRWGMAGLAGAGWMNQGAGESWLLVGQWVTRRIVISQEYKRINWGTVKHEEAAQELRPLQLKQLVMVTCNFFLQYYYFYLCWNQGMFDYLRSRWAANSQQRYK